jgi:hypothetical protein
VQTFFNAALPEKGASLASPVSGAIVRWRLVGAAGGPFRLRVLRPNGLGAYTAVGTSGPATPAGTGLQTFNTNLPVRSGDLLAVDPTNPTDELGFAATAGASYGTIFPLPFEGATVPSREPVSGKEIELSAEVQPMPEVESVGPRGGSIKGGTEVTIAGADLTGASAVTIGGKPAASFKVEADDEIVATVPASKKVGSVAVAVTTVAGTSAENATSRFIYRGCVVPKLHNKGLRAAKRLLRRNRCKPGKVILRRGATRARGKVKRQWPKPRTVRPPQAKVKVLLR